ncbi:MAG: hypothetical protein AABW59_03355 [archaeon]
MLCQTGEENTCLTDCAPKVNANVAINVSGAYDSQGTLSVKWHNNNDVSFNASDVVTSRLGDNWYGSENKNLYLSFSNSQSGEVPITNDNRTANFTFTQPGDYYFEVVSSDYDYRGVSEKITISESKDYYVNLELTPGNPAIRIRATDQYGIPLTGYGEVKMYEVQQYYDKYGTGDWKTDEYLIGSYSFSEGQEINALFWLFSPSRDPTGQTNTYFKAVTTKQGYADGMVDYIYPYNKYTEFYATMNKNNSNTTGSIKIQIVPGTGTTENDLQRLVGETIEVCGDNYPCNTLAINDSLVLLLENYPTGNYSIYSTYIGYGGDNPSEVPILIDYTNFSIVEGTSYLDATATLGILLKMQVEGANGELVDPDVIKVEKFCYVYADSSEYCDDYSAAGMTWTQWIGPNPYISAGYYYSGDTTIASFKLVMSFNGSAPLEYDFMTKQGMNDIRFILDDATDHNYSKKITPGESIVLEANPESGNKFMRIEFVDAVKTSDTSNVKATLNMYNQSGTLLKVVGSMDWNSSIRDEFGSKYLSQDAILISVDKGYEDKYYAKLQIE